MKNYTEQRLKEFDDKFNCIDNNCDGSGNIPHQVGDDEWEAEQCQFHAEYLFPIKLFLTESIQQAEQEMYIQGFKDGFQHSTEGFNGEYQHPDVPKNFLEEDAKEALLYYRQTIK